MQFRIPDVLFVQYTGETVVFKSPDVSLLHMNKQLPAIFSKDFLGFSNVLLFSERGKLFCYSIYYILLPDSFCKYPPPQVLRCMRTVLNCRNKHWVLTWYRQEPSIPNTSVLHWASLKLIGTPINLTGILLINERSMKE